MALSSFTGSCFLSRSKIKAGCCVHFNSWVRAGRYLRYLFFFRLKLMKMVRLLMQNSRHLVVVQQSLLVLWLQNGLRAKM